MPETALHPQVQALLEAGDPTPALGPADLVAVRASYLETAMALGGAVETVAAVEDVVIDGPAGVSIRARTYRPQVAADPLGALLWFHGGGWIMGDLDGFDRVARSLANAAGAIVVSVDYRLAPEHPFPAAMQDADAAVVWARGHGAQQLGFDADRVAVGGDSAGGNLAAVAARHAGAALRTQLLVYPALDTAMDTRSFDTRRDGPMLTAAEMAQCWETYLGAHDRADPDACPARAGDLSGVAPAFIAIAGYDVLRDEGEAYARALQAAGVAVTLREYDDMTHGFLRWGGVVDRAHELIADLGAATRAALG